MYLLKFIKEARKKAPVVKIYKETKEKKRQLLKLIKEPRKKAPVVKILCGILENYKEWVFRMPLL